MKCALGFTLWSPKIQLNSVAEIGLQWDSVRSIFAGCRFLIQFTLVKSSQILAVGRIDDSNCNMGSKAINKSSYLNIGRTSFFTTYYNTQQALLKKWGLGRL